MQQFLKEYQTGKETEEKEIFVNWRVVQTSGICMYKYESMKMYIFTYVNMNLRCT